MSYGHITFAQAKVQLAERLSDTGNVFFTDTATYSEIGGYIQEALRTFNAMTGYWRNRGTFATDANTAWYDLATKLSSLRGYTLYDRDLLTQMQYHLLEKTDTAGWTWAGTEMFTLDDVTQALTRRRNQFLLETGCVLAVVTQASGVAPVGRVGLTSDSIIEVRRLAWKDLSNVYTSLWRDDDFSANAFNVGWSLTPVVTPSSYSVSVTPPLTVQIIPVCQNIGTLEMVVCQCPAALNPVAGVKLNIPDDYAWAVKFGALADLLGREGSSRDPMRAQYCERRYQEGVELARLAAMTVKASMPVAANESPLRVSTVAELDAFRAGWQNESGVPDTVAIAGFNLLGLAKVPDATPYSVTVDLIQNAVVPAAAGDFLQIGREELDVILDYAQHLAAFKQGGAEFMATAIHYDRLRRLAVIRNEQLRAASSFADILDDQTRKAELQVPRRSPQTTVLEA